MTRRSRSHHQRRWGDQPRLLLRRQRRAGEFARGDDGQSRGDQSGVQCRGRRTHKPQRSLCRNPPAARAGPPAYHEARPKYGPFRAGDVRHSLADISKARRLLGYEPTHRLGEGLKLAMRCYVGSPRSPLADGGGPSRRVFIVAEFAVADDGNRSIILFDVRHPRPVGGAQAELSDRTGAHEGRRAAASGDVGGLLSTARAEPATCTPVQITLSL